MDRHHTGEELRYEQQKGAPGGRRILLDRSGGSYYMDMEEYLPGVIARQMPVEYEPEALKAQAIIARTYICRQIEAAGEGDEIAESALDMDYLESDQLKKLWGSGRFPHYYQKLEDAVKATSGIVMTYEGRCIDPMYCRAAAGMTRMGDFTHPYLQIVDCRGMWRRRVICRWLHFLRMSLQPASTASPRPLPGPGGPSPPRFRAPYRSRPGMRRDMWTRYRSADTAIRGRRSSMPWDFSPQPFPWTPMRSRYGSRPRESDTVTASASGQPTRRQRRGGGQKTFLDIFIKILRFFLNNHSRFGKNSTEVINVKEKVNQMFKDKLFLVMLVLGLLTIVAAAGVFTVQRGKGNEANPYLEVPQPEMIAQETAPEIPPVAGSSEGTKNAKDDTQAPTRAAVAKNENQGNDLAAEAGAGQNAAEALVLNFNDASKMTWPVRGNVVLDYSMDQTIYFPTLDQYKCNPGIVIQSDVSTPVEAPANARSWKWASAMKSAVTLSWTSEMSTKPPAASLRKSAQRRASI